MDFMGFHGGSMDFWEGITVRSFVRSTCAGPEEASTSLDFGRPLLGPEMP